MIERWFVVLSLDACYGLGAMDSVVFFVGKEGDQTFLDKTLQDIKPFIVAQKAKVVELK